MQAGLAWPATGAAGVSLARSAFAQGASSGVTATKLSEGFSLITGAGTNVVSVTGPDGALMVDSGAPERSAELLKAIASQAGGKPVKTLFTTHWHPDHTGANEALGKSGAKIIAHAYTKQWMSTEIDWGWQKKTFEPAPKAALPTEIFYDGTQKLSFGAEAVQYGHLAQAHTDGDMYVYFPGPNILVAGDVVSVASYPILDYTTGGWITGIVNAQKTLLQVANADTKIIPGNRSGTDSRRSAGAERDVRYRPGPAGKAAEDGFRAQGNGRGEAHPGIRRQIRRSRVIYPQRLSRLVGTRS